MSAFSNQPKKSEYLDLALYKNYTNNLLIISKFFENNFETNDSDIIHLLNDVSILQRASFSSYSNYIKEQRYKESSIGEKYSVKNVTWICEAGATYTPAKAN